MQDVDHSSAQEQMLQQQVIERGVRDERVLAAMRAVPRDRFFAPSTRHRAFADHAASIGFGQTISQPFMVALMTQRLDIRPTDRVLEIGTGSGYQTAILAHLAKQVYSVERIKPLLDSAWERVMDQHLRNVVFRLGDGATACRAEAPFDRILIAAGAPELPRLLLSEQLADGGQAVLPVGHEDNQMLIHVHRKGHTLHTTEICPCRFVKLIGKEGYSENGDDPTE